MKYPYQVISTNPKIPPAPILRIALSYPNQSGDRLYELEAFLDTGADMTLIPLEAVSILRLPLLDERIPVLGVGGAVTVGACPKGRILGDFRAKTASKSPRIGGFRGPAIVATIV
jgi:hypothetical protein